MGHSNPTNKHTLLALSLVFFSVASQAWAGQCDYFASPDGDGNGLSQGSPFSIGEFWSAAAPGRTLCLLDGTYRGSGSMIKPPSGLSGREGEPITVRALNDGAVTLDGEFSEYPVLMRYNEYFVIEGLSAHSGPGAVVYLYGANRNKLRRVVAWDAHNPDPSQWGTDQGNSAVYAVGSDSEHNLLEDCAGFGLARKVLSNSQGGNYLTIRRCWFSWDGSVAHGPKMALTFSYNSHHATVENVVATFTGARMPERYEVLEYDGGYYDGSQMTNYEVWNPFGVLSADRIDATDKRAFARILGSLFYLRPGARAYPWAAIHTDGFDGVELRDVVAYVDGANVPPLELDTLQSGKANELTLVDSTAIGQVTSSIHADWQKSNLLQAESVNQAFGPGENVFNTSRGANLCHRYVDGARTTEPLWPWPMNQRIIDAMEQAGYQPVDVTASVEEMFGSIPQACGAGSINAPPAPTASDSSYTDRVRVTWSAITDATNYQLFRCADTSTGSCSNQTETSALSYDDLSAAPGVTYYYRLKACSLAGCSDYGAADAGTRAAGYRVTVSESGEHGESGIVSIPAGIDCGSACSYDFDEVTILELHVVLADGYQFDGWSGDTCDSVVGNTCTLTVNGDLALTASFSLSDQDNDGIPDASDPDDDNDGIADWADPDPLDANVALAPVWPADTAARVNHSWSSVDAATGFLDAVVIAGPPTYNGDHPGVVRLRNVSDRGFDLRFQEWDYRQRDFSDTYHVFEDIPYLVLQPGRHTLSDGSEWEVGTFPLDGTSAWQSVLFNQTFLSPPHLFLTVQTEDDVQAVSVRARNVTELGFEAALFEEQALMDGHASELVGYLAVQSPTGGALVDLDGVDVPYLLQRLKGDERWSPVLSQRLKVEEERSQDWETGHTDETLHVLAIGEQFLAQQISHNGADTTALRRLEPTEDAPMEWGLIRGIDHDWRTLPFAKTYTDPVLVAKPASSNGADPGVIRLRNVGADHAELRYQEWDYLNGNHWAAEDVFYLVSEAGQHSLGGLTVEADWLTSNKLGSAGQWDGIFFSEHFANVPVVLAAVMTYNESDAVTTHIDNLDLSGLDLAMGEQESKDDGHTSETLGWIAIQPGIGTTAEGRKLQVFFEKLDHVLAPVAYPTATSHRHPTVLGGVDSTNGPDPVSLRYANPTNAQIELILIEEKSADYETSHIEEDVGVFAGE